MGPQVCLGPMKIDTVMRNVYTPVIDCECLSKEVMSLQKADTYQSKQNFSNRPQPQPNNIHLPNASCWTTTNQTLGKYAFIKANPSLNIPRQQKQAESAPVLT